MAKNPGYLGSHCWTVGGLYDARERVIWTCRACKEWGFVDLKAIGERRGWDFSLVDKESHCKLPGCKGQVHFMYGSPARPLKALRERQAAAKVQAEDMQMEEARRLYNRLARKLHRPMI